MIGLDPLIKKRVTYWASYKWEGGSRKHFVVLHKLIFYDVISIAKTNPFASLKAKIINKNNLI